MRVLALILIASIAACGGGGSESGSAPGSAATGCVSISGGNTRINFNTSTSNCTGCEMQDSSKAIDGNLDSHAVATFSLSGVGSFPIRATAQAGTVFTSGARPGIKINFQQNPTEATAVGFSLSTYLNDVEQEVIALKAAGACDSCDATDRILRGDTVTTKQFDALEIRLSRSAPGTEKSIKLYEFCSDSTSG